MIRLGAPSRGRRPGTQGEHEWRQVTRIRSARHIRQLVVAGGDRIEVHRFACAGVGDFIRTDDEGRTWVRAGDAVLPVSPPYRESSRHVVAPGVVVPFTIREIVTERDLSAYESLSAFHYRSDDGFGRRCILVMASDTDDFPPFLGFVEVATPFLHLRNRSRLLDSPFSDPSRGISWTAWDLATRNSLTNTVARISRLVIHPEARGIGLTRPMIECAARFATQRWQVKGLRPVFLEITADMLRFMPFVAGHGMRYIGESEGNLSRLRKDMSYLLKAEETRRATGTTASGQTSHAVLTGRGRGILGRQRRDVALIAQAVHAELGDVDDLLERALDGDESMRELLPLLRHPKPTYMMGLTPTASAFLQTRCATLGLPPHPPRPPMADSASPPPIVVSGLTVSYEVDTGDLTAPQSSDVRRAFGLTRSFRFTTGVNDLSFRAPAGTITYVIGPSGSGKSTLLAVIAGRELKGATVAGKVQGLRLDALGEPAALADGVPLISAIGAESLEAAIYALNAAGLAEPRLYLSRYEQLSAGQRYRAQLAALISSGMGVWLIDEFASGLDNGTAIAVARNFSRVARSLGVTLIAAGVRTSPLVEALQPDQVVRLSALGPAIVEERASNA